MARGTWKTWLGGAAVASCGFVGFVGLLHTEAGRPLLHWVANRAGCPVSFDGADPEKVEALRRRELEKRVGGDAPKGRRAFWFELGSSRAEVERKLERAAVACSSVRQGSVLRCEKLEEKGLPEVRELHLQFDSAARLVAVDLFRETRTGEEALSYLGRVSARLANDVGPVTRTFGEESATFLEGARLRRVAHRFEYADYVAELGAMNYGARGVRVRERYQWLPPQAS